MKDTIDLRSVLTLTRQRLVASRKRTLRRHSVRVARSVWSGSRSCVVECRNFIVGGEPLRYLLRKLFFRFASKSCLTQGELYCVVRFWPSAAWPDRHPSAGQRDMWRSRELGRACFSLWLCLPDWGGAGLKRPWLHVGFLLRQLQNLQERAGCLSASW